MEIAVTTWNIGGCQRIDDSEAGREDLQYFRQRLSDAPSHVICLQEAHAYPSESRPSQASVLASELDFPYLLEQPLCRSHLDAKANLSLAILSRSPLFSASYVPLPTPPLRKRMADGVWTLHPKGVLTASTIFAGLELNLVCGHAHPFHLFDRDPLDPELTASRSTLDTTITSLGGGLILGGIDLNDERFEQMLPSSAQIGVRSLFRLPTTPQGLQQDHLVYLGNAMTPTAWQVTSTAADHYLARGVFELGDEKP